MKCPSCGAYMQGNKCIYCGYVEYVPHDVKTARDFEHMVSKGRYEFENEYNKAASTTIAAIHNSRFDIGFRGYDVSQVDRFLDELAEKINYHGNYGNINAPFDYNDINNVKFAQGLGGYDTRHVDAFLDKLTEAVKGLSRVKNKYK